MNRTSLKIKPAAVFSLLFVFFSAALLFSFRSVPVSKLWNGYGVFYVYSDELSENDIAYILEKNGCKNIIYRGNQRYPVVSAVSPVQPQAQDSYIYKRNFFFTDKTNSAHVFYVPDGQGRNLEKASVEISSFQNSVCGTDSRSSFPWIAPIATLLFALILLYFSHEKKLFFASSFIPVFFSFCRPLYTVGAAVIFLLFSFFLLQKIWLRRNFKKTFFNSPYALVFTFSPFLFLIFSSPLNALFYILSLLSSACCINVYKELENAVSLKYDFNPVLIMPSRMIPMIGRNGIRLMALMSFFLFLLVLAFLFLGNISKAGNDFSSPSLPSPVSKNDSSLPDFSDFLAWSWNTISFPYRRLSSPAEKPNDGDFVVVPDYADKNGLISESETKMYVFDKNFRDSVAAEVEKLEYPALEKMMARQGKNSSYGYSKGKIFASEKFGLVLLFGFALISAAFSGFYIIGRKRYGLSI